MRLLRALVTKSVKHEKQGTVYLHYPCFDGLISAVLMAEFFERHEGWKLKQVRPVNYDLSADWLKTPLSVPCAVVDFLYHPEATFWADHHVSTFVSESARRSYEARSTAPGVFYDERSRSCASLLWRNLGEHLSAREPFREMVAWAEKIDSASYDSVEEAVFGDAPALRISFSLMARNGDDYCEFLVRKLREHNLRGVSSLKEVVVRYEEVRARMRRGLERLRDHIFRLDDGRIVAFDVETSDDVIVSRYAPYLFLRNARYSIGIFRYGDRARITAMRNPWLEFQSAPLGKMFQKYGGGGHERVASVVLLGSRVNDAEEIATSLLNDIREAESSPVAVRENAIA